MTGPQSVPEGVRVGEAAAFLQRELGAAKDRLGLALVLGSGLKDFAGGLRGSLEIPFSAVPHWPSPRVADHGGALVVGDAGQVPVACLTGRVHLYEGWTPAEVVRAVRTLRALGVGTFLLTNAAGGIAEGLRTGDLMALTDHLNLTGSSPLTGAEEPTLGPRFPDQSAVYHPELRAILKGIRPDLPEGVYAGLLGPSYETPAEVRMLRTLGAAAVGMSTVHEAMALNAMGARVCGLSLIANLAAGFAQRPLSHDEVIAAGKLAAVTMRSLVAEFCGRVAR